MAPVLLLLSLFCLLGYAALGLLFWRGLRRLSFDASREEPLAAAFSILIPCRDDDALLAHTLQSLAGARAGCTGAWEVIVVDDHSAPAGARALQRLLATYPDNHRLLRHSGAPGKKAALQAARREARYDLLVQTDADAIWEPGALARLLAPLRDERMLLTFGAVRMRPARSTASRFAALEYLSLQMSGQALAAVHRPYLGSAANLAYRRAALQTTELPGKGWQSGDDVFLMQALHRQQPGSVVPVASARAVTPAPRTWGGFLRQRIRWGGKAGAYPLAGSRWLAAGIALHSLGLVMLWGMALFWPQAALYALLAHGAKAAVDAPLLWRYARGTRQEALLADYAWVAALYPFYIVLTGLLILLPVRWQWKGRPLRRRPFSG